MKARALVYVQASTDSLDESGRSGALAHQLFEACLDEINRIGALIEVPPKKWTRV